MANRLDGFDQPTVWHEFTPLAIRHNAVNLGQGFPDWPCDAFVKDAAKAAVDGDWNQYARPQGHLRLVKALASHYAMALEHAVTPETDVAVGVGATEVMYAALAGLLSSADDEVIVMEPAFDIYAAQVQMAGGTCRFVPLRFCPDRVQFELDHAATEAAFSAKTRVLILNSPHNPTGTIFTADDLACIAALVEKHPNVVVICDDVYEHIAFGPYPRFAALPRMFNRTITVGSAGKTFSVTGWKIGWAVGPASLIQRIHLANNWIQFSVATPLQEAVAVMLERAAHPFEGFTSYYAYVADRYRRNRDRLVAAFAALGLPVVVAQGGAFLFVDVSQVAVPATYAGSPDYAFCRFLTAEVRVTAIPTSAFCSDANKALGHRYARFAYCKSDDALTLAIERLQALVVRKA